MPNIILLVSSGLTPPGSCSSTEEKSKHEECKICSSIGSNLISLQQQIKTLSITVNNLITSNDSNLVRDVNKEDNGQSGNYIDDQLKAYREKHRAIHESSYRPKSKNDVKADILIIGDSMTRGLVPARLSKRRIACKTLPGAKLEDAYDRVCDSVQMSKPAQVIFHLGTNNVMIDDSSEIVAKHTSLIEELKKCHGFEFVTISSIILSAQRELGNSKEGEVVHITVLTEKYTTIETLSGVQYQCYRSVPDRDASLSFGRSAPITTNRSPPSDQPHFVYSHVRVIRFPNNNNWPSDGFGPFYCEAEKEDRDITRVTTFFQRSDAKFITSDGVFTKTVNVNDTGVVISMANRYQPDDNGNVITWRKDGIDVLTQFEGQTSINFPNPIQISDQGIYEIYYGGERDQNRGGIYRLIVRECPAGKWGPPECYGICDNCYNGGVCDDKSGLCICPNNFMGENCLEICRDNGGNKFGLTCEFFCSSSNSPTSCRGLLFCLPDPYGCSCDVGSQGLACDSACDVGTYGPGCSQTCHCADVSSCDSFSGICTTGGCQSGWSGNNCQIPDICEAGYYGSQCTDKCHCMDDVSCDKTTGACPEKCALGYSIRDGQENCQECEGGTFGLDCLQQCHCAQEACGIQRGLCDGQCLDGWFGPYCQRISRYEVVRVNPYQPSIITCYVEGIPLPDASSVDLRRRIDTNTYNITGITKRSSSVSGSERGVHFDIENVYPPEDGDYVCGLIIENQFYPTSITNITYVLPVISTAPSIVSTTSTTVSIQWNAWSAGEDIGDPPLIGYDVFVLRKGGIWEIDQRVDDSITSAIVSNLTPDTDYRFRVAAVREGEGGTGPWSPRIDAITLCTAPMSPPAGIQVTANNPKELEVTWEFISLESANCRSGVTHYIIYYALFGSSSTNSRIVSNDTRPYTITGLETYLDYIIQISASNKDEEGDKSRETTGKTQEEVAPAPINVAIPRSTESSFTVSWSTPLPPNVNGRIQMYNIRFKQSDQGDDGDYIMENVLTVAFEAEHTVTNLLYGVNYTVQVQTVNGAGSSKWSYPVRAKTILAGHHCNGVQVGTIIAGVSIPLIIIIIFLIILNVVTYRRARLRHPVTASSKDTAREPSPRYENPAFDASMRTCKNVDKDTYQDLDIDTRDYQNPTDPHTYQGLKKTSIDTSHQSVSQPEPEITYEYI
nr:angiopoietin-1 receptor-like [Lytechinus pictus]